MLYDLMDKLGERCIYSDTDSVIFVSKEGDWVPETGPFLGELTDEINGDIGGDGVECTSVMECFVRRNKMLRLQNTP